MSGSAVSCGIAYVCYLKGGRITFCYAFKAQCDQRAGTFLSTPGATIRALNVFALDAPTLDLRMLSEYSSTGEREIVDRWPFTQGP